jgi:hypothetical protein
MKYTKRTQKKKKKRKRKKEKEKEKENYIKPPSSCPCPD